MGGHTAKGKGFVLVLVRGDFMEHSKGIKFIPVWKGSLLLGLEQREAQTWVQHLLCHSLVARPSWALDLKFWVSSNG